jgi:stage IV sporulation protein FB
MGWSLGLASVAATELRVHVAFFLLLVWIAASGWSQGGVAAAIDGVVLVTPIFLCLALHEIGHAIAAQHDGISTPDMTLSPIGGFARRERMPEKPAREPVVALPGPAVNVNIAAALRQ